MNLLAVGGLLIFGAVFFGGAFLGGLRQRRHRTATPHEQRDKTNA
jgi:hypothetical protein